MNSGAAKPKVAIPKAGPVPEAVSGAHETREVEPRAATVDASRTCLQTLPGRSIGRCVSIIVSPLVLNPFIHITQHVVQAPRVRLLFSYRVGFAITVPGVPGDGLQSHRLIFSDLDGTVI